MGAHKGKQQSRRNSRRTNKQELRSKLFLEYKKPIIDPAPFLILTTQSSQFEIPLN
jgi:hypothetical protein